MNKKLKQELKTAFDVPIPKTKAEFLASLPYPKATTFEFYFSQIKYIRKRFWCLSILLMIGMMLLTKIAVNGYTAVGILSAALPLLTILGIMELNKSTSYHMSELEISCKYNLVKIMLIRLAILGSFHFLILFILLIAFVSQNEYGLLRYILYMITPFFLSTYCSLFVTNLLKTRDNLYICSGITIFISICILILNKNFAIIYTAQLTIFWISVFILITILLFKEIKKLVTQKEEFQWNLV